MNYIPYARQCIDSKDIRAVVDALKSEYITQGPRVEEFENKVAGYCKARYAVALNSGTSALHAACFVAGIKPADEVITSPVSFAASSNCVLYCGGRPVFADVLADTITIDPDAIRKAVTKKTKAIIAVDFAGHPAELEDIRRIASKHGLIVIEDAAHALGAEYRGRKTGSCRYSDMTTLSFHAVKHITTGEGGMVLTNRKDFYDKLVMFRSHGISRDKSVLINKKKAGWFYQMQLLGFNYRLTDIQCALGLSQLGKIDYFIKRRREIAENYKRKFFDTQEIACLQERDYAMSSWHIFPIRVNKNRDAVFNELKSKGIGVNVHYIPVYSHPYYKKLGYRNFCPEAGKYYKQAVTLPLYPKMSDSQVNRVAKAVKAAIKKS